MRRRQLLVTGFQALTLVGSCTSLWPSQAQALGGTLPPQGERAPDSLARRAGRCGEGNQHADDEHRQGDQHQNDAPATGQCR